MDRSITEYFYEPDGPDGHRCGYCGLTDTSVSNGMWTHFLTCEDYQDLIDRGWRRSGKYCYKPVMDKTCCPLYAIRCEATNFRLSKSQKAVLKKMNEFLLRDKKNTSGRPGGGETAELQTASSDSSAATSAAEKSSSESAAKVPKTVHPGVGADPNKPPCRKAKLVRKELKQQKLATKAESGGGGVEAEQATKPSSSSNPADRSYLDIGPDGRKPLEMFLALPASDKAPAHKLELKLIRSSPPSPEFKATFKSSYAIYKKYQMAVHHDSEEHCTEKQFQRFLCDSPLIPKKGVQGWPCDYGSYHQHYYVDGKLVMVGVVDILPKCLSSVYVFYDPDYAFLTMGVYSALRELEMVRKLFPHNPSFEFYYMGYYVHRCQKMRYKGQYYPSYLLSPESYHFIPIEQCRPKLEASKYSRLNDEAMDPERVRLDDTLILFQRQAMPYAIFKAICGDIHDAKVTEFAKFVGPNVATRMLLSLT